MKSLILAAAAAAALSTGAVAPAANAQPALQLTPVQFGFYLYGGRQYCYYFDGWRGPGWYWCGYAYRRGYGWGGPEGWRGWDRGGRGHHERWRGEAWERGWGRGDRGDRGDHGRGDYGRGGDHGGDRGGDHGRGGGDHGRGH